MAEAGEGGVPMPSLGEGHSQQAKDQAKQSNANPYRQATAGIHTVLSANLCCILSCSFWGRLCNRILVAT